MNLRWIGANTLVMYILYSAYLSEVLYMMYKGGKEWYTLMAPFQLGSIPRLYTRSQNILLSQHVQQGNYMSLPVHNLHTRSQTHNTTATSWVYSGVQKWWNRLGSHLGFKLQDITDNTTTSTHIHHVKTKQEAVSSPSASHTTCRLFSSNGVWTSIGGRCIGELKRTC